MAKDIQIRGDEPMGSQMKSVAFIKADRTAQVQASDEDWVMTFPHLVIRGAMVFQILVIVLTIMSLLFDAPLKSIADPLHTELPAKAPWYFLGLQELLHYFPPVVGGVLIPLLVLVALGVIPYFEVNFKPLGLWEGDQRMTLRWISITTAVIFFSMIYFHAWAIAGPTVVIYLLMLLPLYSDRSTGFIAWLRRKTEWQWVMTWFILLVVVLTCIGIFFRGPYWRWSWPWIEGIY